MSSLSQADNSFRGLCHMSLCLFYCGVILYGYRHYPASAYVTETTGYSFREQQLNRHRIGWFRSTDKETPFSLLTLFRYLGNAAAESNDDLTEVQAGKPNSLAILGHKNYPLKKITSKDA